MDGNDGRRMFWGFALIIVGAFLLIERFGGMPYWFGDYAWWGGLVVLLGLVALGTARRAGSVGTGVTLTLLGVWVLLVTNHVLGFGWYNSWPLALVAAGAGTVAHAIAAHWLPDTKRPRRRRRWRDGVDDSVEDKGHA